MVIGISDEIMALRKYIGDYLISIERDDDLIDAVFEEVVLITMLKMCIYDWVLETMICQDMLRDELIENIISVLHSFAISESIGNGKRCSNVYTDSYLNPSDDRMMDEDVCYEEEVIVGSDVNSPVAFNSEDELIDNAISLACSYYDLLLDHVVNNPNESTYRIINRFRRLFYRMARREISYKDKIDVNLYRRTAKIYLHDVRKRNALFNAVRSLRRDL